MMYAPKGPLGIPPEPLGEVDMARTSDNGENGIDYEDYPPP